MPDAKVMYVMIALILLTVLVIVILGVVLVLNGFIMVKKEGRRLQNLLGLFLGLAMLGYVGLALSSAINDNVNIFFWVLCLGIPLAYLGFGFTSYLLYSWLYLWVTKRRKRVEPPGAVIVLGAGLIKGKVPPLLASRLDAGMAVADGAGDEEKPLLIVSGGQGSDEVRSEASAMAEYLVSKGVPEQRILQENLSRTTQENLANTKVMLEQEGITGPLAVVTNNFHAFRAALLLSREGLKGYAVGAPTARYYWPAAVIREYVAILRDSLAFTIVCLGFSALPLLVLVVMSVVDLVRVFIH